MVNQVGNVVDVKMERPASFSSPKQGEGKLKQGDGQQNVKPGEQFAGNSFEGGAAVSGVSAIISGEEKMPFDSRMKKEIMPEDAEKMSEALNEFMDKLNCNIEFKYNDKLDFMTIKMIDKKTKEVIREFPPEEILKTMEKTQEWIGIFLDRKA